MISDDLFDYEFNRWEVATNPSGTFRTSNLNLRDFVKTRNDQFLRMLGMDVNAAIRKAIPKSLYYWFDNISFKSVMSVDIYPNFELCFTKTGFLTSYEENLHTINTVCFGLEGWICDMAVRAKRDIEYKIKREVNGIYGLSAIKEKENIMPTNNTNEFTVTLNGLYVMPSITEIEKVIFNDPATIVFWKDGTKTVVKVKPGEKFDKWTGLAMAYMKKIHGSKFHSLFRRWCDAKEDES